MATIASQALSIRATVVDKCPVHRPGDLLLACGRELWSTGTQPLCAYFATRLLPILEALEQGKDPQTTGLILDHGGFPCRGPKCTARFELQTLTLSELAHRRGDPPQHPKTPLQNGTSHAELTAVHTEARTSFVGQLPAGLARELLSSGERRVFPENEIILQEGRPGEAVYFLLSGQVAICKTPPDGVQIELARLGPGEVFGEMSFLSGDPVNATVRTTQPTKVVALAPERFDQLMMANPVLHRWFSRLFAERLRITNVRLEERLTRGMTGRLSMISLPEIIQTLALTRQTGVLALHRSGATGQLWLENGQLRRAIARDKVGEEAFHSLVNWTDGQFSFLKESPSNLEPNLRQDTMQLLMEAARRADEASGSASH